MAYDYLIKNLNFVWWLFFTHSNISVTWSRKLRYHFQLQTIQSHRIKISTEHHYICGSNVVLPLRDLYLIIIMRLPDCHLAGDTGTASAPCSYSYPLLTHPHTDHDFVHCESTIITFSAREPPTLDVRIWCLKLQILTSKVVPRAERVKHLHRS